MDLEDLKKTAENLEQRIVGAKSETRLALQPQFTRVLDKMTAAGEPVPARLRRLDSALIDEAIEARFDNLPV